MAPSRNRTLPAAIAANASLFILYSAALLLSAVPELPETELLSVPAELPETELLSAAPSSPEVSSAFTT